MLKRNIERTARHFSRFLALSAIAAAVVLIVLDPNVAAEETFQLSATRPIRTPVPVILTPGELTNTPTPAAGATSCEEQSSLPSSCTTGPVFGEAPTNGGHKTAPTPTHTPTPPPTDTPTSSGQDRLTVSRVLPSIQSVEATVGDSIEFRAKISGGPAAIIIWELEPADSDPSGITTVELICEEIPDAVSTTYSSCLIPFAKAGVFSVFVYTADKYNPDDDGVRGFNSFDEWRVEVLPSTDTTPTTVTPTYTATATPTSSIPEHYRLSLSRVSPSQETVEVNAGDSLNFEAYIFGSPIDMVIWESDSSVLATVAEHCEEAHARSRTALLTSCKIPFPDEGVVVVSANVIEHYNAEGVSQFLSISWQVNVLPSTDTTPTTVTPTFTPTATPTPTFTPTPTTYGETDLLSVSRVSPSSEQIEVTVGRSIKFQASVTGIVDIIRWESEIADIHHSEIADVDVHCRESHQRSRIARLSSCTISLPDEGEFLVAAYATKEFNLDGVTQFRYAEWRVKVVSAGSPPTVTPTFTPTATVSPTPTFTPTPTATPSPTPTAERPIPECPEFEEDDGASGEMVCTYIDVGQNGDLTGFIDYDELGEIGDRSFYVDETNIRFEEIAHDESIDRLTVEFDRCLPHSEFVAIHIGRRKFSDPDKVKYSDERCEQDSLADQRFSWDVNRSPLEPGERILIVLYLMDYVSGYGHDLYTWIQYGTHSRGRYRGFDSGDAGWLADRTISIQNEVYRVTDLEYDRQREEIDLKFDNCIFPGWFEELWIRGEPFIRPEARYSDEQCDEHPTWNQQFTFGQAKNPFTGSRSKRHRVKIIFDIDSLPPVTPVPENRSPIIEDRSPDRRVQLYVGQPQSFEIEGADPEGDRGKIEWLINDDVIRQKTIESDAAYDDTRKISFANRGDYRLTARLTDSEGDSVEFTWEIDVIVDYYRDSMSEHEQVLFDAQECVKHMQQAGVDFVESTIGLLSSFEAIRATRDAVYSLVGLIASTLGGTAFAIYDEQRGNPERLEQWVSDLEQFADGSGITQLYGMLWLAFEEEDYTYMACRTTADTAILILAKKLPVKRAAGKADSVAKAAASASKFFSFASKFKKIRADFEDALNRMPDTNYGYATKVLKGKVPEDELAAVVSAGRKEELAFAVALSKNGYPIKNMGKQYFKKDRHGNLDRTVTEAEIDIITEIDGKIVGIELEGAPRKGVDRILENRRILREDVGQDAEFMYLNSGARAAQQKESLLIQNGIDYYWLGR